MIGPVLFVLCCLAIPKSAFPALAERAAIGTVAWMAFWWVTAPIDYAVTAFLPIAINALVTMCDMSAIISLCFRNYLVIIRSINFLLFHGKKQDLIRELQHLYWD